MARHPLSWIVLAALVVRLYACMTTYIVNPDGIHYIHQARSIFYGQWNDLTTCNINYVSMLPLLIASAFAIVRDWVIAGRCVTLLFGTATLIPLYFLLKRFLNQTLCNLTVLIYAFIPVFVSRSADIVRGPIYWFFLCLGFLYFVRQWDSDQGRDRYRGDLILSCIFFLLAAWTRTEGAYAIIVSGFYLLVARSDQKLVRILYFSIPMGLIITAGATAFALSDAMSAHHLRLDRIITESTQFIPSYQALREQLRALISQHDGAMFEFLSHVRTLAWFMPLSIIFNTIWEGFFYPYALIYLIGFIGLRQRLHTQRHIGYFIWLSLFSIAVLYVHLLINWLIFHRFLVILILPSCLIIGFGIDNIMRYLQHKFQLRPTATVGIMVLFIVLFGLPKNLLLREQDKHIFREAGQIIAQQKAHDQTAPIMAACSTVYQWVFFYAHLEYPGTRCATHRCDKIPTNYGRLVAKLKATDVSYLLYEEKKWPKKKFDLMQAPYQTDFDVLGSWQHKDTGDLVLLKLK